VNGELLAELEGRYSPVKGKLPAVRSPLERWRSNRWNEGGDKMSADRHGYADDYARLLARWDTPTLVEVGVFQGASLAIWCDLFPQGRVVGLDVDLSRYWQHRPELKAAGAFALSDPVVVDGWDAYAPNVTALAQALDGRTIDVLVDDGPHTDVAVLSVYDAVAPLLSPSFTYIVEDMPNGADLLATRTDGQFGQAGLLGWVET
jgi:cephalosporin hydroxylase